MSVRGFQGRIHVYCLILTDSFNIGSSEKQGLFVMYGMSLILPSSFNSLRDDHLNPYLDDNDSMRHTVSLYMQCGSTLSIQFGPLISKRYNYAFAASAFSRVALCSASSSSSMF